MIKNVKQRSLLTSVLCVGALMVQTGCAGTDKEQSELATDVTQVEAAEAPAPEAEPAPSTETAEAVPAPAPAAPAVEPAPAPAPAPAPEAAAPVDGRPRLVRYISVKEAVLRAAPSDSAAKVGVLPKGERVMIVEEEGWGRVADNMFVKLNALSNKAVPRKREKASWSKPGR